MSLTRLVFPSHLQRTKERQAMEDERNAQLPRHHIARTDGGDFLRSLRERLGKVRRRIELAAYARPTNSPRNLCLAVGRSRVAEDEPVRVLHGAASAVGDAHRLDTAGVDGRDGAANEQNHRVGESKTNRFLLSPVSRLHSLINLSPSPAGAG
jgi:hypothetical protein